MKRRTVVTQHGNQPASRRHTKRLAASHSAPRTQHLLGRCFVQGCSTPVDNEYKREEENDQLDHPHHLLFWKLSKDFCYVHYVFPLQVYSEVVE